MRQSGDFSVIGVNYRVQMPEHRGHHGVTHIIPNYICRYAWSQMVEDTDDGLPVHVYDGSLFARECCVIHELGHLFNAGHQDSSGTNKATYWLDPAPHFTVMWTDYFGPLLSSHEYSSPTYHGDTDHNNAGAINTAKSDIASIT